MRPNTPFLISAIGNDLYQKLKDDHEREQQQKVTEVEKRAWLLASEEKARAVKGAREAAELELEKAMAAAKKAQVNSLLNMQFQHVLEWFSYREGVGHFLCCTSLVMAYPLRILLVRALTAVAQTTGL